MYTIGRRSHHRSHRAAVWLVCLLFLMCSLLGVRQLLRTTRPPQSVIHNAGPHTTSFQAATTSTTHVDKPLISFDVPAGWHETTTSTVTPTPSYVFSSPSSQAKRLAIYIDTTPSSLAVNRVITVRSTGDSLDHDMVSDNCVTFTPSDVVGVASGVAAGKWQGTNFLCDEGNYQRDVVGITSTEDVNVVTLTGQKSGTHKLFVTYTDNNNNPDFTTLYSMLDTLRLK